MSTWPWSRGSHDELLHGPRLREFWSGAADFSRALSEGRRPSFKFRKESRSLVACIPGCWQP